MRTEEARLQQCGQLRPDCFSSEPIHHCGCMAGCSRLDCGTGPGLVRSRHRVQLRAWNHLAVFRHDWAVWLQLNRGRREEGRSQVRTLGWAGDDISKFWFQITKFPFKLSTNVAFSLPPADTKRPLHEYKAT